jgi:hypothetical protein
MVLLTPRPECCIVIVCSLATQPNIDRKAGPEDWRYREAATFVFGCILEGPSPDQLAQLVLPGLTFLLQVGTLLLSLAFSAENLCVILHAVGSAGRLEGNGVICI